MSRTEKRAPLPVDPELAANEQRRREELARSGPYQRGVALAKADDMRNCQSRFEAELGRLKRSTLTRDDSVAARDKYNHAYNDALAAGERLAKATGKPMAGFPKWLPPPAAVEEDTITIEVPKPAADALLNPLGKVAKPTGMGKDGKGGPAPNFADPVAMDAWLNVQGAKP